MKDQRLVTVLLIVAAAFFAAALSHWAIDVLGDYLVADDTYDHIDHGSRLAVTLAALAAASFASWRALGPLLHAGRAQRVRLTFALSPRYALAAMVPAAILALAIVPSMEWLDALQHGGDVDSVADLFGGSLALGIATTLGSVVACGLAILAFLRWIGRHRDRIVTFFTRAGRMLRPLDASSIRLRARTQTPSYALVLARRRSKRGPPS